MGTTANNPAAGWRLWIWLALLLLGPVGCSQSPERVPVRDLSPPPYHLVSRGDSLYSIAFQYGLNYRKLADWNGIRSPYTIYPGQKISLEPGSRAKTTKTTSKSSKLLKSRSSAAKKSPQSAKKHPRGAGKSRKNGSRRTTGKGTASRTNTGSKGRGGGISWAWPTKGPILRSYDPKGVGKKGVDIGGKAGQVVRAAAAGKVVYSGSGLKGYGKLIIIKHDKNYLSAYAHNQSLAAKEGDRVKQGQPIARLGSTGASRVMLHFEIRHDGKAVDPMRYLPVRRP